MKARGISLENDILLKTLFNYIVPFFNNKHTEINSDKKQNNLESKLNNTEHKKIDFEDILFLEQLILSNIKRPNKNDEIKIKKEIKPGKDDFSGLFLNENKDIGAEIEEEIKYSLSIIKKKSAGEEKNYSVSIKYEENNEEQRLDVSFELDNYGLGKLEPLNGINKNNLDKIKNNPKEAYFFSIINKKGNKNSNDKNYSIKISYEDSYEEERLSINYKSAIGAYLNKRQQAMHDFSDRVPGKFVNVFPESIMGGVLGFTYLGENFMGLRADLTGSLKKMVDIHESIHTPDEYETRILTDWIMMKQRPKYIK